MRDHLQIGKCEKIVQISNNTFDDKTLKTKARVEDCMLIQPAEADQLAFWLGSATEKLHSSLTMDRARLLELSDRDNLELFK